MEVTISQKQISEYANKMLEANISAWSSEANTMLPDYGFYDKEAIYNELHRLQILKVIEVFETTTAIHLYMKETAASGSTRGLHKPEKTDLSHFIKFAVNKSNQYGKVREPWEAKGAKLFKMKLSEAVSFRNTQEAYADYSTTLIPVTVDREPTAEEAGIAQSNVFDFFRRADSHTGWAGSGCNYSAGLEHNSAGWFIVLTCRASISD